MHRHLLSSLLLALFLSACASTRVDIPQDLPTRNALPPQAGGPLQDIEQRIVETQGSEVSGFHLLDANEEALRWLLALIDAARHSIDLQYYLWYGDAAGKLMTRHLIDAADRGVTVRLLVDDINTMISDAATLKQRDGRAALLDSHPNIELRLFNPWRNRDIVSRVGESVADMKRVNARMHNKAMIVDNRAAIIGGRNIGDDYMGLHEAFNFHDLDVLGIGPVARQASVVFDSFWNSPAVLPVEALKIGTTEAESESARRALDQELRSLRSIARFPLVAEDSSAALSGLRGILRFGTSEVYSDLPTADGIRHEMLDLFYRLVDGSRQELLITNAYIIPADRGVSKMAELTARGVDVRVLTNSLASHDVPAVNSHYKKWRRPLLESGVRLFEMRHDAAIQSEVADTAPTRAGFMGLHVKALVIDRQRTYIGSMNLDPRSAAINSEMGVVVESRALAEDLARLMQRDMRPENAWEVKLEPGGSLRWVAGEEMLTRQPARSAWQRIQDVLFMLFPRDFY